MVRGTGSWQYISCENKACIDDAAKMDKATKRENEVRYRACLQRDDRLVHEILLISQSGFAMYASPDEIREVVRSTMPCDAKTEF